MRDVLSRAARLALASLAVITVAMAWAAVASAATPEVGTVGNAPNPPFQEWQGNTYAVSTGGDPMACPSRPGDPTSFICDHYRLTVANSGQVQVRIDWDDPDAAFIVRVYQCPSSDINASCDLFVVGGVMPGQAFQDVNFPATGNTTYEVRVQPNFVFLPATYRGCAAFRPRANCTSTGGVINATIDPPVSISNARVTEGDSGTAQAKFAVTLGWPTVTPVTVNYVTKDRSATGGLDYIPSTGTVVIPAGQTSATVSIPVIGDVVNESDETFEVDIALAEPGILVAVINDPQGFGTITDDDWRRLVSGTGKVGLLSQGSLSVWVAENRTGTVNYRDSSVRFYATKITAATFTDATHSATVNGNGYNNGHSVTFTLQVADNGVGALDTYVLTLSDGTRVTGPLTSGDLSYTG